MSNCLRHCSQELLDRGSEELESLHGPLQGPQPQLRSVCLFPNAQAGETPPRPLGGWCWIPQLPQMYFCSCMEAKYLLLSRSQTKGCLVTVILISLWRRPLIIWFHHASLNPNLLSFSACEAQLQRPPPSFPSLSCRVLQAFSVCEHQSNITSWNCSPNPARILWYL